MSFRPRFVSVLLVILTAAFGGQSARGQDVRINEIMGANSVTLADEDDDFTDWIELYNSGSAPVDLTGFGLSDDPEDPYKWTVPPLTLPPDAHALIFASGKDRENVARHWETLIDLGDVWSYRVNSQPPSNWNEPGFDAGAWSSGASGFGYGDGDDATELPLGSVVVFTRTSFAIEDTANIERAVLHVDYDDGFVAYLNGVEIARANVSGSSPGAGRTADEAREAEHYQGGSLEAFDIPSFDALLTPGENVLAVQVHNVAVNSSDLSLIPILSVGMSEPPANPNGLSDLARSLESVRPHSNFQLSRDGESVVLTSPDGTIHDEVTFPSLPQDVSFGRAPDGSDGWAYFDVPTPHAPNASTGFAGRLTPPAFNEAPGLYDLPSITVALEIGDGEGEIRYTLDGSEPTETSRLYEEPMTFASTTVVRARTFAPAHLPSPIVSGTYLLRERTTLPIVAIATDPEHLWDHETGIYVLGPDAESAVPHFGANFWQDWEIPVHLEVFEAGATRPVVSQGAGVQIFGGWSRAHPQKSLAVFARGRYGADAIDYPLLPDKPIDSYQAFVLRNGGNDWSYTLFRDAMMQYLIRDAGVDMLGYRPVIVFLNGEYWGIQNIREKVNEHYVAANHPGVDQDGIDMLEVLGPPSDFGIIHGSDQHLRELLDYVTSRPMTSESDLEAVDNRMDVAEFIDYQVAQIYYVNEDWPGNNQKLWRPAIPGGRWRWILYDTDFGFGLYSGNYAHQTLDFATASNGPSWPNPPHSTLLLRRLLLNPAFKAAFINRFADHLNATFRPARVRALIDEMADVIRAEIPRHNVRWNGALSSWSHHVERMRVFADRRPAPMWSHLRSFFDLPPPVSLTIDSDPTSGGGVRINRLNVEAFPWSGSYFPGVPVTVEARPAPGYRFTGWNGTVVSSDPVISVDPAPGFTLVAEFEAGSTSTGTIVVTEIQYNAPDDMDTADWIELYNSHPVTVDLSGWVFMDDDDAHSFVLPDGTQLTERSYLVLCRDPVAFASVHSNVECVGPWGDFGLGSGGDMVRLFGAEGAMSDSISFDNEAPWPAEPDGDGATLELADASLDNSIATNWAASTVRGGTPGTDNSISVSVEPTTPYEAPTFALHPNHPNPFRDATTIRYELDRRRHVIVKIFDVLGREVRTLVDAERNAGVHTVSLPASDLSSGLYLCRLEAADQILMRTMLVVK